jgi:hypothetical protein
MLFLKEGTPDVKGYQLICQKSQRAASGFSFCSATLQHFSQLIS